LIEDEVKVEVEVADPLVVSVCSQKVQKLTKPRRTAERFADRSP